MSDATLFPIFLKLAGRHCLVVGAGRIGEGKIRGLLECGARVQVVSPTATKQVLEWAQSGAILWQQRQFQTTDLKQMFVAVAATSSPLVNELVFAEASRRNVLCNVVDVPGRCDFFYPSVVRRGKLQIAISTSGESPTLAQRLRMELEQLIPDEYGDWIEEIGEKRRTFLRSDPDPVHRLDVLRALSSQEGFEAYRNHGGRDRKESL